MEAYVIQPSSVPVDRRMRRAKSDGIDAELLLRTLLAWLRGEPRVCSMVPIPDEADEDARRCVRERTELISERVGLTNRIGGDCWISRPRYRYRSQRGAGDYGVRGGMVGLLAGAVDYEAWDGGVRYPAFECACRSSDAPR